MARQWYVNKNEQCYGPFADAELVQLARQSELQPLDRIRQGDQGPWIAAGRIPEIFDGAPEPASAVSQTVHLGDHRSSNHSTQPTENRPSNRTYLLAASGAACVVAPLLAFLAFGLTSRPQTATESQVAAQSPAEEVDPRAKIDVGGEANGATELTLDLQFPIAAKADSALAASSGLSMSARELTTALRQSVVKLTRADGYGSAFVIRPDGIIVTNFHVIDGAPSMTAQFEDGREIPVAGYLAVSEGKDLAILKLDGQAGLVPLTFETEEPETGEAAYVYGAPRGRGYSLSDGIVTALNTGVQIAPLVDPAATWIETTTLIAPGNSGGPLVNDRGKVVGVVSNYKREGQDLNLAIAARHIDELMREASPMPQRLADLPVSKNRKTLEQAQAQQIAAKKQQEEDAERARLALAQQQAAEADAAQREMEQQRKDAALSQRNEIELNRIAQRMDTLRGELLEVESEGQRLEMMCRDIRARGKALVKANKQLDAYANRANARIAELHNAIQAVRNRENINAMGGTVILGPTPNIGAMYTEISNLEFNLTVGRNQYQQNISAYRELEHQLNSLLQQVQFKVQQRTRILDEQAQLTAQQQQIKLGVK